MKKAIAILFLAILLSPTLVSADELWVKNEGSLQILVEGKVTDVQLSGATNIKEGVGDGEYSALYGWNPEYGENQTMVVAASISDGWVVITGDIESWDIQEACGQSANDVIPEVRLVKDAPNPVTFDGVSDGGKSISDMNVEKDIAEYNSWFATQSWNELD